MINFKAITLTSNNKNQDLKLESLMNDEYKIARSIESKDFITLILAKEIDTIVQPTQIMEAEIIETVPDDLGVLVEEAIKTKDKFG